MLAPSALYRLLGCVLLLCALAFASWTTLRRVARANHVTATDAAAAQPDADSSTGYTAERRWLIVPQHHVPSYERIAETQQMLATGEWRLRHVGYENAPEGRPVYSSSDYRWWLAAMAWVDQSISNRPLAYCVERAGVWSEPLLHALLLTGGAIFVASSFGFPATIWFCLAAVFMFPLGASFVPAAPDDRTIARLFALGSVLPLVAGVRLGAMPNSAAGLTRLRRSFAVAGVFGGLGLWVDAPHQIWVLLGVAAGGSLSGLAKRSHTRGTAQPIALTLPWRAWGWTGAVTSLLAYALEYAPSHLALRLEHNHPLYGLAWIGVAELLALNEARSRSDAVVRRWPRTLALLLSAAALTSLPAAIVYAPPPGWWSGDLFSSHLTHQPNGLAAPNFAAWLRRDGLSVAITATLAPLALLFPAVAMLVRGRAETWRRRSVGIAAGAAGVGIPFALMQLEWWATVQLLLLPLLVVLVYDESADSRTRSTISRIPWLVAAGITIILGAVQLRPLPVSGDNFAFTPQEAEALLERAAAHWVAERSASSQAVVLLPPNRTTRWCFHGGPRLRGVGSVAQENRDGLAATIRIVTAQTGEEAQALLQERGVTHLVMPSWDKELQQFAQIALKDANDAFISAVHQWALPSWLRPIPYPLPAVPGFEAESIVILAVTDESNRASALARMLEFFLETNRTELADAAGEALRQFPTDPNALVALAQLQKARQRANEFAESVSSIAAGLSAGFDRGMPWDRRVSLAVVLAQADRHDLARQQVQRCVERMDHERILSLTTGALYRLQVLARSYDVPFQDPALRERAFQLLPAPLQQRLNP
jgi:hypothetical protein